MEGGSGARIRCKLRSRTEFPMEETKVSKSIVASPDVSRLIPASIFTPVGSISERFRHPQESDIIAGVLPLQHSCISFGFEGRPA